MLGFAYRGGEGVDKNANEAAAWIRKSAEQG
jgi:TPR repeat protein